MKTTVAFCLLCAAAPVMAQAVPTGFADEAVITGLSQPVGMAFLPDGRILVAEQTTHNVKVWNGVTTATCGTITNVSNSGGERGLLAIAVDPAWPTRPYIYAYYSTTSPQNLRLAMFTMTGSLSDGTSTNLTLGAEYDILTDIPDSASNHNGGAIRFGPLDGMLYLSIGDDATGCNAQTLSLLSGCILRIDVSTLPGTGSGPPLKSALIPASGQPFTSGSDNEQLHWAYGLRNPFRFHIDSVTGDLFVADVGLSTWEELDWGVGGGINYGWPWYEGNALSTGCGGATPTGLTGPIDVLNHTTGAAAIMSMGRYRSQTGALFDFGSSYDGDVFYTDYYAGMLRRLQYNGTSWALAASVPGQPNATDWGTGFTNVSDAATGADGALYYVRQFPGSVRRVKSTANLPTLTVTAGANEACNATFPSPIPLAVQATQFGAPLAGLDVTFTVTAGSGTLGTQPVTTDANGFASTTFTPGTLTTNDPQVSASSPTAATAVTFNLVWRGLKMTYLPSINFLSGTVRHSQTSAPITLAVDVAPAGPFLSTVWGDIWTSVLAPLPTLGVLDGLGLLGTPDPAIHTGAALPTYTLTLRNLAPTGGLTVVFQAYGIDTVRLPADDAYFISNKVQVVLN